MTPDSRRVGGVRSLILHFRTGGRRRSGSRGRRASQLKQLPVDEDKAVHSEEGRMEKKSRHHRCQC